MKIILPVLFFALFTAVLTQDDVDSDNSTTTSIETTTPTTVESTTITTSDASSTTSVTTTSSSTTSSSTSTSTSSPTPTPSPVPTSSVPPTKAPEPEKCQFNATCIRAELQADFIVDIEGKKYPIILGCNASYSGTDCTSSNETQTLVLSESTYRLTMIFEKEANKVVAKNITFSYNLPEGSGVASNYSDDIFHVKAGNSYFCKSKFDIYLENVTMVVHEIHIQAFLEEGKNYGAIEECEADEKVSDIVPIAVGVALAALIIIVLIAYLVGRRRSRQKGYQSV